jgi:hypothetical protein
MLFVQYVEHLQQGLSVSANPRPKFSSEKLMPTKHVAVGIISMKMSKSRRYFLWKKRSGLSLDT